MLLARLLAWAVVAGGAPEEAEAPVADRLETTGGRVLNVLVREYRDGKFIVEMLPKSLGRHPKVLSGIRATLPAEQVARIMFAPRMSPAQFELAMDRLEAMKERADEAMKRLSAMEARARRRAPRSSTPQSGRRQAGQPSIAPAIHQPAPASEPAVRIVHVRAYGGSDARAVGEVANQSGLSRMVTVKVLVYRGSELVKTLTGMVTPLPLPSGRRGVFEVSLRYAPRWDSVKVIVSNAVEWRGR